MAGNQTAAKSTATFQSGALFGAVTGIAMHLARDLVLSPNDGEDEVDLAIRLLGEMSPMAEAAVAEIAMLKRQLAGHKGQATRARAQLAAAMPSKPRKFGPIERQLPPGDLLELIAAADIVELAFVDRTAEIRGLAPRTIEGGPSAWQASSRGRLRLNVPSLLIEGPPAGNPSYRLTGYALLLDGEQVAWAERPEPVVIAPGSSNEFRDDVIFG